MTRNGKIARLSRELREELNQRLEQSEESPQLLAWLNALPEVKEVVQDHFAGVPISKQNLSEWRQGGFQEWLAREEMWHGVRNMEEFTRHVDEERDNVLADDVATVLAARYAGLLTNWNGEVDEKFEARAQVLNNICRSVVQLQRSMHRAKQDNEEFIRGLEAEHQKHREKLKKMQLDQVWAITREPVVAELFGGGELGRKLAKYVVALENDMPGAKLDITDEDLQKAKQGRRKSKPAKTKQATPDEEDKPLEDNEMNGATEVQSEPSQSESVKVGQTDLAEPPKPLMEDQD